EKFRDMTPEQRQRLQRELRRKRRQRLERLRRGNAPPGAGGQQSQSE
ncbi:MAG: hypothetical protein GTO67_05585, partial [Gammaproteobacteria bacterium]|nr:hypothetical protein [Gammaproteobacteria bacterium]NIM71978.1 hypothetical protein [Gammaproteobacteria bacterium]NIN38165.1 hypothetical protein [Gammaproteobacteria bacterium]NIO25589.1 hypothetical protein [Gammaproteobacteria bacterium]NIO64348.1 hypothetical protein [Gammaproteobacteria bacterium]